MNKNNLTKKKRKKVYKFVQTDLFIKILFINL